MEHKVNKQDTSVHLVGNMCSLLMLIFVNKIIFSVLNNDKDQN